MYDDKNADLALSLSAFISSMTHSQMVKEESLSLPHYSFYIIIKFKSNYSFLLTILLTMLP